MKPQPVLPVQPQTPDAKLMPRGTARDTGTLPAGRNVYRASVRSTADQSSRAPL